MSESSLSFPSEFVFKIIGEANKTFEATVITIINSHFPNLTEGAFRYTPSKNNKYLSITVTVKAVSQAQLDATYRDLTAHPDIMFVL